MDELRMAGMSKEDAERFAHELAGSDVEMLERARRLFHKEAEWCWHNGFHDKCLYYYWMEILATPELTRHE